VSVHVCVHVCVCVWKYVIISMRTEMLHSVNAVSFMSVRVCVVASVRVSVSVCVRVHSWKFLFTSLKHTHVYACMCAHASSLPRFLRLSLCFSFSLSRAYTLAHTKA